MFRAQQNAFDDVVGKYPIYAAGSFAGVVVAAICRAPFVSCILKSAG